MKLSSSFSATYHYYEHEGEPELSARFGDVAEHAPYIVVDIGPFTIFNLTPEQLRKLAAACTRAADELERKQEQGQRIEESE